MAETSAQPHSGNNAKSMALTLDEVFALKTSSNHAKRKFKLTPLSKKACLIHGIEPYVLQDREYASFSEPSLDPEIQTMRFEAYSYTRSKLMQVVSNERSKLAARANTSNDSFSTNDSVSFISKTSSLDRKEQEVSTLIENEKRRLEKVANRQKKELIRMLAYESKSQEVMNKVRIKAGEQEKKEMERKKAKRKSELQAAEEARLRELRRRAKEDAEMDLQRLQMQGQFEREKKIQRERQIQEKETRRILRLEDERRAKKQAAYRIEMKKKSEQQQREIELRMKQREEKEREREAKIELKRLVDAQAAELKRKEKQEQLDANLKAAREREEEKRTELLRKQQRHEQLMNEILEEKHVEIEQQEERNAAMERKRKYQLKMKREREEALKQSVQCKIDEEEAALKHLEEQRRKEQMLLKAERDLQKQLKKETLDRIKRKREYQMRETMRKVEENDKRSNELKKKKEELLRLRKKSAHESKVKKDKLMAVIEQSKTSGGSSAIKKILRKISMNEDKVVDLTPAKIRNISSNSVSDEMDDSILSMDPPPEAPSFAKRMVKDDSTAMPYQSPYQSPYITDTDFSDFKSMKI